MLDDDSVCLGFLCDEHGCLRHFFNNENLLNCCRSAKQENDRIFHRLYVSKAKMP